METHFNLGMGLFGCNYGNVYVTNLFQIIITNHILSHNTEYILQQFWNISPSLCVLETVLKSAWSFNLFHLE